ncbi:IQ domain-containing protein K isoform X2 [Aethina tumida]|nr:IQ domain-containing protein K isoform X2 [Aethina tumida]XP_049819831.1 IQ domain-containing protein K isoform X2 [Aethina tumida]
MVDNVFPVLKPAMKVMLEKAVENDSCYIPKTVFDGVDFLCEYLYYENPNHPERKENIVPLHELEWVKKSLKESPRPFYPKHRIWKKEYGALIIQCWFRGHTVRSRPEVQEVRQFWRTLEKPLVVDETEIPESITETGLNESL